MKSLQPSKGSKICRYKLQCLILEVQCPHSSANIRVPPFRNGVTVLLVAKYVRVNKEFDFLTPSSTNYFQQNG